jgi:hypothetical protein
MAAVDPARERRDAVGVGVKRAGGRLTDARRQAPAMTATRPVI